MTFSSEPLDMAVVLEGENGEPDREVKATVQGDAAVAVRALLYGLHREILALQNRLITEGVDLEDT